jgi:dTDP-4-amino-4,6-dideoxygalactose transaminase
VIRLTIPSIEEDDLQAVREALVSGYLVQGERVAAFEQAVADYIDSSYAVAVSSCTAALHIALLALDVRPRDIVLVTAYSWIATANVIELCGAKPAFVDICPDTFNMDPNCLEKELGQLMADTETAGRVKAILPVHTFGQMADMPLILELASRYDLPVIEDAACALGASLNGRQAGTWGVMGCFSLHPRKAITTGEGGVIGTNDSNLARRLRALRNHGQDPEASPPDFIIPGFNYRMTEFQAALGLTQMGKLNRIIKARRRLAAYYDERLAETSFTVPRVVDSSPVYQSYVVLLANRLAKFRHELILRLKEKGIETTIGTWHIPMTSYYRARYKYQARDFPIADKVFALSLTLPLYEKLTKDEQDLVIDSLLSEEV